MVHLFAAALLGFSLIAAGIPHARAFSITEATPTAPGQAVRGDFIAITVPDAASEARLADVEWRAQLIDAALAGREPSPSCIIQFVRPDQSLILPEAAKPSGARGANANTLAFTFDSPLAPWTPEEIDHMRRLLADVMPVATAIYGPPAFDITVNVRKDPQAPFPWYSSAWNEIGLTGSYVDGTLCHEAIHAFHDDAVIGIGAYEEGMTGAATAAVGARLLTGGYSFSNIWHGGQDAYYENYNQPPLAALHGGFMTNPRRQLRYDMSDYAWSKLELENSEFLAQFNAAYYPARAASGVPIWSINEEPALKAIVRTIQPSVEGLDLDAWYARQHILKNLWPPTTGFAVYQGWLEEDALAASTQVQVFRRDVSETPVANAPVDVHVYDHTGLEIASASMLTTYDGTAWFRMELPPDHATYVGRLRVEGVATTPDGMQTAVTYRSHGRMEGLFGVVRDALDGEVTAGLVGGSARATTRLTNGCFDFPSLVDVPGTFQVTFTYPDGRTQTRIVTKDRSSYFVLLGLTEPGISLEPVADTYIEARTEATWDHGASDHLDVDLSPFGITYLRFDLRGIPGPVARATLTLHCTNTSDDGGTIYPVRDSSWVEGERTGLDSSSANGPGLEWTQVDTNRDGAITAADTSPYVPDFTAPIVALGAVKAGQTLTVDVTAAFGAGPGLYTLAIKSTSTDGATYSSRQHPTIAWRPRLELAVCGDGAVEPGEECDPGPDVPDDCCLASCVLASPETVCRHAIGSCDLEETCTGTAPECPADVFSPPEACFPDECHVGVCDGGGTCTNPMPRLVCGDGHVCGTEVCDPPGSRGGCPLDTVCSNDCATCVTATCGNGIVEPGEQCDPGTDVPDDCCTLTCRFAPQGDWCPGPEFGCVVHGCDGQGTCVEQVRGFDCGDGFTCDLEVCDPPNHPGRCPAGSICSDTCLACVEGICGNGVFEYPEQCDDGNLVNGDACDSNCLISGANADTYVETGGEKAREHGGCNHLDVDRTPASMAYLTFDVPFQWYTLMRATLKLHVLDSSDDGGTIYPAYCAWAEGSRCGASGAGLRWTDVDCNGDGTIDERDWSCGLCLPDFSRPIAQLGRVTAGTDIAIDVTRLVGFYYGGWGYVNLVLKSTSTDRAIYASRQHATVAWRPQLELIDLPNDDCDTPTVIASTPFIDTIDTRSAWYPDGDPDPTCGATDNSVWYEFTPPADGNVTVNTLGSDYDTTLAAYVGTTCNVERNDLTELGCNDDAGGGVQSELSFHVTGGVRYLIKVADRDEGGILRLRLDFQAQPTNCCTPHPDPGCDSAACEACVCAEEPDCCTTGWDQLCVDVASEDTVCRASCPCASVCGDGIVGAGEQCDDGNVLDGDACDSACRISGPVADTYIEARTEATWDHGASDHLDVDLSPFGIAYLRFDLRGVPGPVTRATLALHCTNTSNDGGTIYPVRNSSWVEGERTGLDGSSANGPGLKWTQVDTNGDGAITAADTSPYVPDFTAPIVALGAVKAGQTLTLDVTAAFGAGPGLYTLAIKSTSTDGATYSSRQHPTVAQRPVLRVDVGP